MTPDPEALNDQGSAIAVPFICPPQAQRLRHMPLQENASRDGGDLSQKALKHAHLKRLDVILVESSVRHFLCIGLPTGDSDKFDAGTP